MYIYTYEVIVLAANNNQLTRAISSGRGDQFNAEQFTLSARGISRIDFQRSLLPLAAIVELKVHIAKDHR